jgi:hypothetical protein
VTRASLYGAAWVLLFAAIVVFGPDTPNPYTHTANAAAVRGTQVQLVQGKGVEWWSRRAVQARKDANARARTIRRLKHVIAGSTKIQTAIDLAAITYHVDAGELSHKASCESTGGHGYNPYAKNRSSTAAGLFQFLDTTWASTPYARFSPYDPLAAALAAGWMHAHGRGSEWVCR